LDVQRKLKEINQLISRVEGIR